MPQVKQGADEIRRGSNSFLNTSDDVLRYSPSDASVQNAQQLAVQLHTSSDAVVLPEVIAAGAHMHLLVAYDASVSFGFAIIPAVNIADVDLVNTSGSPQSSTNNLNVYASDMVSLIGVSLTILGKTRRGSARLTSWPLPMAWTTPILGRGPLAQPLPRFPTFSSPASRAELRLI